MTAPSNASLQTAKEGPFLCLFASTRLFGELNGVRLQLQSITTRKDYAWECVGRWGVHLASAVKAPRRAEAG